MARKEVAVKKYVVRLSAEERAQLAACSLQLAAFIGARKRSARLLTKARILYVPEAELARRRAAWQAPEPPGSGYQGLYVRHVMQADRGADFDFLTGCRGADVPAQSH